MKVYDCKLGRLGNAIFRYFASTLFCILYKAKRTYTQNDCSNMFTDANFIEWSNSVLNGVIPEIDDSKTFIFYGFFQHDKIFIKYRKAIINWIITHPDELLYTDGNDGVITYYNYKQVSYKSLNLVVNLHPLKVYNIVVHIRLEDFINNNDVIHPESIKTILDELNERDICLVVNKPTTELENKYIDYFKQFYNITIESNTIIEDLHIMKNAKILICSCSTISWVASFLSDKAILVYLPDYNNNRIHETFKKPTENTILYPFNKINKDDLELFLNASIPITVSPIPSLTSTLPTTVNSLPTTVNSIPSLTSSQPLISSSMNSDIYCAVNCKKEPITKRILEYIGNIENGFYIEAGAYDGILQSNTKFLEDEYNWTGLLIEPSPKVFLELQNNRSSNININKCLVSSSYTNKQIKGAFDNGPMSSVNNIRNLENVELIDVDCDTLENILDYYDIQKIDFMTVDTEGYELEVLEGLNLMKYRPTYLLIEIYETQKKILFNYLENNNYIFLENITNYNKFDNPGWDGTHNDYLFKTM